LVSVAFAVQSTVAPIRSGDASAGLRETMCTVALAGAHTAASVAAPSHQPLFQARRTPPQASPGY
jgi:hypothetical protein